MCKGPEVRTTSLPLRNCKKVACVECREKLGEWLDVIWTVGRDQYRQVLKLLIFKIGQ